MNSASQKIICSVEPYDSILDCHRPNGTSRTWNIEEEGRISRLHTLPSWYDLLTFKESEENRLILDEDFELIEIKDIEKQKHIYIISVFNPEYFTLNDRIGFKCISDKIIEDTREGRALIVIDATAEGVYNDSVFSEIIEPDKWSKEINLPKDSVVVLAGNLKAEKEAIKRNLNIRCIGVSSFESWINPKTLPTSLIEFEPDSKHLFLFYSRVPRVHRVYMGFLLTKAGLIDKGKASLILEETPFGHYTVPEIYTEEFADFCKGPNRYLDVENSENMNMAFLHNFQHYRSTFMSIVGETFAHDDSVFFSEKIFKSISLGHPFLLLGGRHSLARLKELGYETYSEWFDESYDSSKLYTTRTRKILNTVQKYSKYNTSDLITIRKEMEEVALHNKIKYINKVSSKEVDTNDLSIKTAMKYLYNSL